MDTERPRLEHLDTLFSCAQAAKACAMLIEHARNHAYMHTYNHVYTYVHTCIHTDIHIYTHTHMHISMHTYTHTRIHTYTHAYIHSQMHICIHTYTKEMIPYMGPYMEEKTRPADQMMLDCDSIQEEARTSNHPMLVFNTMHTPLAPSPML